MSASSIRAGRAFVELFADAGPLERGLRDASAKLAAWGRAIGVAGRQLMTFGGGVLGAAAASIVAFGNMGSSLVEMSMRTGIAIESLGELTYAAALSSTSMEALERFSERVDRKLVEAAEHGGEAALAFENMGLSVHDLLAMNPEGRLMAIGEAVRGMGTEMRNARLIALGNRAGAMLGPALSNLPEGRAAARASGAVMSAEDAHAAKEFSAALAGVQLQLGAVVAQIGGALLPVVRPMVTWLAENVKLLIAWIRANPAVIATVTGLAGAVGALGIGMVALGGILGVASSGLFILGNIGRAVAVFYAGPLFSALRWVATALIGSTEAGRGMLLNLGVIGSVALVAAVGLGAYVIAIMAVKAWTWLSFAATTAWTAAVWLFNVAMTAHKIIAGLAAFATGLFAVAGYTAIPATTGLTVAVTALNIATIVLTISFYALIAFGAILATYFTIVLVHSLSSAGFALKGLGELMGEVSGTFQTAWAGISDAMAAGDMEMAMRIATVGLKSIWLELIGFLENNWTHFVSWLSIGLRRAVIDSNLEMMRAQRQIAASAGLEWTLGQSPIFTRTEDALRDRAADLNREEQGENRRHAGFQNPHQAGIDAANAELADAQHEAEFNLRNANEARRKALEKAGSGAAAGIAGAGSSMGTFSARQAESFGASSPAERTARAADQTVELLQQIRTAMQQNILVWRA